MSEDLDALAKAIEEATKKVVEQLEEMRKGIEKETKRIVEEAGKIKLSRPASRSTPAPKPLSEQGG